MRREIGTLGKGVLAATIALGVVPAVIPTPTYAAQAVVKDYTNHVYKTYIEYAVKNKFMWLDATGNFKPNQNITQADLVSGLVNAKRLTAGTPVQGLPANHWAKVYYERAKKDGILDGVTVNPNKVLTREEASLMMNNAWKSMYRMYQKKRQVYSDVAVGGGWIPKKAGKFANGVSTSTADGLGTVTRGEEAVALYLLNKDVNDTKVGEDIALKFHNSLKNSGGYLVGTVPSAQGKDIKLVLRFKNNNIVSYKSGNVIKVNASQILDMEFSVKNSGQAKPIALYSYDGSNLTARKNAR